MWFPVTSATEGSARRRAIARSTVSSGSRRTSSHPRTPSAWNERACTSAAREGARPCLNRTSTSPGTTWCPLDRGSRTEGSSSLAPAGALAAADPIIPARTKHAARAVADRLGTRKKDLPGGLVLNIGAKQAEDEETGYAVGGLIRPACLGRRI